MSADLPTIEKYHVLYSEPEHGAVGKYTIGLCLVGDGDQKVDREITTMDKRICEIANIGFSPESALEKTSNMIKDYIDRLHKREVTQVEMSHIGYILERTNNMLFYHVENRYGNN